MANTRLPSDGKDLEDARRLRQMLSPDLAEVLHMLDAFETDLQPRSLNAGSVVPIPPACDKAWTGSHQEPLQLWGRCHHMRTRFPR